MKHGLIETPQITTDGHVALPEQASDPDTVADQVSVYSKDDGGTAQLYARDGAGATHQLTPIGTQYVLKSLYDASSIVKADVDDTPIVLSVTPETVVGRPAGSSIVEAMSRGQIEHIQRTSGVVTDSATGTQINWVPGGLAQAWRRAWQIRLNPASLMSIDSLDASESSVSDFVYEKVLFNDSLQDIAIFDETETSGTLANRFRTPLQRNYILRFNEAVRIFYNIGLPSPRWCILDPHFPTEWESTKITSNTVLSGTGRSIQYRFFDGAGTYSITMPNLARHGDEVILKENSGSGAGAVTFQIAGASLQLETTGGSLAASEVFSTAWVMRHYKWDNSPVAGWYIIGAYN